MGDHHLLGPSCYFLAWLWEQIHSPSGYPWKVFSLLSAIAGRLSESSDRWPALYTGPAGAP